MLSESGQLLDRILVRSVDAARVLLYGPIVSIFVANAAVILLIPQRQ